MNHNLRSSLVSIAAFAAAAAALASGPGEVDFTKLVAPAKGQYVEITLGPGMLKLAGVVARCKNAEVADLISGLSRIRVNVARLDDGNRKANTERIRGLRDDLAHQGWESVAQVRGDRDEDVVILVKQRSGEVIEGVVVTVIDGRKREAVFVNIVGSIRPEQLSAVGEHLDLKPLRRKSGERI